MHSGKVKPGRPRFKLPGQRHGTPGLLPDEIAEFYATVNAHREARVKPAKKKPRRLLHLLAMKVA